MERVFRSITVRRAEVLRELADAYSEREIAEHLGIAVGGVRSHVEQLRALTGQPGVRELGRWWRENRAGWLGAMAAAAGDEYGQPGPYHQDPPKLP
jgi:DNA-binding CsgD family transcriptional regulator